MRYMFEIIYKNLKNKGHVSKINPYKIPKSKN